MSNQALQNQPHTLMVQLVKGPGAGSTTTFHKDVIKVGRDPENDLALTSDIKSSRFHAEIYWTPKGPMIKNISTKNHLLVNNKQITRETRIYHDTTITLGDTEIKIYAPGFERPTVANPQKPTHLSLIQEANIKARSSPLPQPQVNRPQPTGFKQTKPRQGFKTDSAKIRFYVIIAVILAAFIYLLTSSPEKKSTDLKVRTTEQIQKDLEKSRLTYDGIIDKKKSTGQLSSQYESAQAYYIKGFRDYRLGQYSRAIVSFQAALSFYPDHALARRYLSLAKRRFDEIVQFNMTQGQFYRQQGNSRLCKSAYRNVLSMIRDPNDKTYTQAKTYYDECSLAMEGRY